MDKKAKRVPLNFQKATPISSHRIYGRILKQTSTPDGVLNSFKSISPNPSLEYAWLEIVNLTEDLTDNVSITWSAYHASKRRGQNFEVSIASLLPLFREESHSVATIKHAMSKIQETTEFLNPGQTPVIAAD